MKRMMLRTVPLTLTFSNPGRFFQLLEQCAQIFNIHARWAYENKSANKKAAHFALYELIKQQFPDVPTAFIQTMRDVALEAVKGTNYEQLPAKDQYSAIRYDVRTLTLRGQQLTLSCIGKREKVIITIPEYFKPIVKEGKLQGATLSYDEKKKEFWIHLNFSFEAPPLLTEGEVVGIDQGEYYHVVTSDGQRHSSKPRRKSRRKFFHLRRSLESLGTPAARRKLKQLGDKEKRLSIQEDHILSKQVSHKPNVRIFVVEDLTHIRKNNRGRKGNKHLHDWSFGRFVSFLMYKAEALGIQVVCVDPRYTSQTCSSCGIKKKSNRRKSMYRCSNCGLHLHADINAAKNIRLKYLSSVPLA